MILNIYIFAELLINTKLSILTLAIFALKLSNDARDIKDLIFKSLIEQKKMHLQWINIFKKLPLGILITNGKKVLHSNKKMIEILGKEKISVLFNSFNSYRTWTSLITAWYFMKIVAVQRDQVLRTQNLFPFQIQYLLSLVRNIRT